MCLNTIKTLLNHPSKVTKFEHLSNNPKYIKHIKNILKR